MQVNYQRALRVVQETLQNLYGGTLLYAGANPSDVRAVAKIQHRRLAELTEKGLSELGFTFLRNGGGDVIEFEVQSPCRCIVSVQNLTQMRLGFPFIPRTKVESMIEIRRMIGGEQQGDVLAKAAESIVGALSSSIPRSKWKGLDKLVP